MNIEYKNIELIKSKIRPMIEKKVGHVFLGVGSMLNMNFGSLTTEEHLVRGEKREYTYGEWSLWIQCCAWRLEEGNQVLAYNENERDKLEAAVKRLEGLTLLSMELFPPAGDTIMTFEQEVVLRLFAIKRDYEHWELYVPDGNVLEFGPGSQWRYVCVANNTDISHTLIQQDNEE